MDQWRGKLAVVTGASSGIGAGIVMTLLEHGVNVAGLARRMDKLRALGDSLKDAKGTFYPIDCDLRKELDIRAAFQEIDRLGGADILVNNAGLTVYGRIVESPTESYKNILEVNVLAAAICTREVVKSMKQRKTNGHIIFMNSILGHTPAAMDFPLTLYETSKCAITAMAAVLRREMRQLQLPIKISCVSPGLVKTDLPVIDEVGGEKIFELLPHLEVKDIAEVVIHILGKPPGVLLQDVLITPLHG